ncbi:MAG: hypothetical protein RLZZ598_1679, partial [Pseudomonadota bacterium]
MRTHAKRRIGGLAPQRATFQRHPVAAGCAVLLMAMGGAYAQSTEPAKDASKDATQLDAVTVTGIRRGIEASISVKKNSDRIVEAINAEDIGKLPDISVAESIARMPGVAAQRTQGRASQISVRGFGPDFATTLLNGREQVTTGDSRGVEYDQYPSELFNAVELSKTTDAGLIGQGLSGTFDLQTVRPLTYGKRAFQVGYRKEQVGVGLEGDKGNGNRFSVSYIDQFADRTVGVALGFARLDQTTAVTQRFEAWGVADATYGAQTVKVPGGFNSWLDQTKQTRDGAMAVLQWKPNKNFESSFDLLYSRFDRDEKTKGFQAPVGWGSAGGYDPGPTGLISPTISGGIATAGTFDNFKGVVRNDTKGFNDKLDSYGWNNKLTVGDWTGMLDLSTSRAKRTGAILETTAGLPGNGNAGGQVGNISWTGFDGSNVGSARFTTDVNYADPSVIKLTDVMGWGGGNATPQAGYSKLPSVQDKLNAVRLAAKRDLPEGWFFSNVDFGLNVADREKTRAYTEGRLIIAGSGGSANPYATANVPGATTTLISGIPVVTWDPRGSIGSVYEIAPKLVRDIANKDWSVSEKITTAYSRFDIDSQFWGLPVRGNAGLQYQHTNQSSRAFNVDGGPCPGDVCPVTDVTAGTTYNDVLPSMNLIGDLGNGHMLRFGLARQLARPTINDMRASLGFGVNTTKNIIEGDGGNPNLKPFRANALDLSYEKYFGTKAYYSVAGFYKDLSTYIVRAGVPFDFAPYVTSTTPLPLPV